MIRISQSVSQPRANRFALVLGLVAALAALPALANSHTENACKTHDKPQTVKRLGASPFVKGGLENRDELNALFIDEAEDIACILQAHGLERLGSALAAAASGDKVIERDLASNECFDWMSWRRRGVAASGPLCLDTKKVYPAYEIPVDEKIAEDLPDARCEITATGDVPTKMIAVSDAGSSPGAQVTWMATNGTSGQLPGGPSWNVEWKDLCTADYTFKVAATDEGSETWVTHKFVVPRICANVAYEGKGEPWTKPLSDSCEKSVVVMHIEPPPPVVTLTASAEKIKTRQPIEVNSTVDTPCLVEHFIEVRDPKGNVIMKLDKFPSTIDFPRPGIYPITAWATDARGQRGEAPADAVPPIRVRPRWTVRGFGAFVDPDDEMVRTETRSTGLVERTKFQLEKGFGVGASAEARLTEIVGLEAGLLVARIDSSLKYDRNSAWAQTSEKVGFTALTFGPNFYLLHDPGKANLYIGPFLGLVNWSDKKYDVLGRSFRRELDNSFGWGAQIGLDVPLGTANPLAFHTAIKYFDASTEVGINELGSDQDIDANPLVFAFGLSYSF